MIPRRGVRAWRARGSSWSGRHRFLAAAGNRHDEKHAWTFHVATVHVLVDSTLLHVDLESVIHVAM